MRGIAGAAFSVDLYLVTLRVGSHLLRGVRAVAIVAGGEPVLGRDALNQLVVTLNGLAGVTEVLN